MLLHLRKEALSAIARKPVFLAAVVVMAGLLTYLPLIGQDKRLASHEGRHAEIASEMWKTGNYSVPHFNGRVYYDKPPLFHWLVAASFALSRHADLASARLPSVLAAVAGAMAVFVLGGLLYDIWAGFIGALMLLFTFLYAQWAVICRMDMVMSAALIWCAVFAALAARSTRPFARYFWIEASGLALALASLSKGFVPLGIGAVLVLVTCICLCERKRQTIPILLLVLITAAAIGSLWVACTLRTDFLHGFWEFQSGGTGPKHQAPFHFYLTRFPLNLLPWSVWLPFAVWHGLRRFREDRSLARALPLIILVLGIVAFSLSGNKRVHYLLPLTPFAALIVSDFVVTRMQESGDLKSLRAIRWPLLGLLAAAPAVAAGLPFAYPGSIRHGFGLVIVGMTAICGVSVFGLWRARKNRLRTALGALMIAFLLLTGPLPSVIAGFYWLPEADVMLARKVAAKIPPGVPIGLLSLQDTLAFSLQEIPMGLGSIDDAASFASQPGEKCIVAEVHTAERLQERLGKSIKSIAVVPYANKSPQAVIMLN